MSSRKNSASFKINKSGRPPQPSPNSNSVNAKLDSPPAPSSSNFDNSSLPPNIVIAPDPHSQVARFTLPLRVITPGEDPTGQYSLPESSYFQKQLQAQLLARTQQTLSQIQPQTSAQPQPRRPQPTQEILSDLDNDATTTKTPAQPSKTVRRGWNRDELFKGGVSVTLLNTLDKFTNNIPQIPNQVDHGKKTHNRDMRGWINSLEESAHAPLWNSLVNTLRSDSTAESYWGHMWDRHLCRYILGKVVSREKASPHNEGRSLSRQAVNNAIKRELDCHFEPKKGGQRVKSTRSKTFRDLFREKCREAGVPVPPYETDVKEGASHTVTTNNSDSSSLAPLHQQPSQQPQQFQHLQQPVESIRPQIQASFVVGKSPIDESRKRSFATYSMVDVDTALAKTVVPAMPIVKTQPVESTNSKLEQLENHRISCQSTVDEWGQTAWWTLPSDDAVRDLPYLLVSKNLFELRSLLLDFRWIKRTFQCIDFTSGMRQISTDGYDLMVRTLNSHPKRFSPMETEGFRLIRNALMLTLPIIKKDGASATKSRSFFAHLATQLTGRLLDLKRRFSNIASLVHSIELHAPRPWLRPLDRYFLQPRTDIKLAVPSNGAKTPHPVVLSDDGSVLVISGTIQFPDKNSQQGISKRHMISIWDVETGKCMLDHEAPQFVHLLALNREKTIVSFATRDGLHFWALRTSQGRTTIGRETQAVPVCKDVKSITFTANSDYVLTTHQAKKSNRKIALWNTQKGTLRRSYDSLLSNADCIDVSPDGKLFVSGHNNGVIHVWSLSLDDDDKNDNLQPILSFQSYVDKTGQHPVVDVNRANKIQDDEDEKHEKRRICSICYHERGQSKLVTAVLKDDYIRVWELPPMLLDLLHSRTPLNKEFMTTICRAYFSAPNARLVQWSKKDRLYTGGDDGMVYEWEWLGDDWQCFPFEKEKNPEEALRSGASSTRQGGSLPGPLNSASNNGELINSTISVGRQSEYVATYLTKSPYVIVYDMSHKRSWDNLYSRAYRSHCALIGASVDQMDIKVLGTLEAKSGKGDDSLTRSGGIPRNPVMPGHDVDQRHTIRQNLEKYFLTLDEKTRVTVPGDMQPRLLMRLGKYTSTQTLEVCFEQSVMWCVSGIFTSDNRPPSNSSIKKGSGTRLASSSDISSELNFNSASAKAAGSTDGTNPGSVRGSKADGGASANGMKGAETGEGMVKTERRGMVAALGDGTVAIFELEEDQFGTINDDHISKMEPHLISDMVQVPTTKRTATPLVPSAAAAANATAEISNALKQQATQRGQQQKPEVKTAQQGSLVQPGSTQGQAEGSQEQGNGGTPMIDDEDNEVEIVEETKSINISRKENETENDGSRTGRNVPRKNVGDDKMVVEWTERASGPSVMPDMVLTQSRYEGLNREDTGGSNAGIAIANDPSNVGSSANREATAIGATPGNVDRDGAVENNMNKSSQAPEANNGDGITTSRLDSDNGNNRVRLNKRPRTS